MKYNVHIVDDDYEVLKALKILIVTDNLTLASDDERIKFSEDLFKFEYFRSVDEAIKFYELGGEHNHPDLIIIDISFDTLEKTGHPKSFLYIWGIEMGKYAHKKFINSARIFLSGNTINPKVNEELKKAGVTFDSLDLVRKAETDHLKERISRMLQRRARYLLTFLDDQQHNLLCRKIEANLDLRKETLDFGLRKMNLRTLLWGYGDIMDMKSEEVNLILDDLIQSLGIDIEFSGPEWKDGYIRFMLNEYQSGNGSHFRDLKDSFDKRALNLLLEILLIKEQYQDSDNEIRLSKKNNIRQLTYNCKQSSLENERIFSHKMIGRRTALGFGKIYENGDDVVGLDVLSSLLSRGITEDRDGKSINAGAIINTGLGLKTEGTRIIANRKTMLLEETQWFRTLGRHAPAIRVFLNEYLPANSDLKACVPLFKEQLIDFSDFEDRLDLVRKQNITLYPRLIEDIKEYLQKMFKDLTPVFERLLDFRFD